MMCIKNQKLQIEYYFVQQINLVAGSPARFFLAGEAEEELKAKSTPGG
jgi:hypothetical protein